jgi:hypothetical protein
MAVVAQAGVTLVLLELLVAVVVGVGLVMGQQILAVVAVAQMATAAPGSLS